MRALERVMRSIRANTPASALIPQLLACLVVGVAVLSASSAGLEARPGERNQIFGYGGNKFIVRADVSGGTLYLRAYRAAGSQWEPFGRASLPAAAEKARRSELRAWAGNNGTRLRFGTPSLVERIYFTGRPLGYSTVDLDNPMNTHLYRAPEGRPWP